MYEQDNEQANWEILSSNMHTTDHHPLSSQGP